MEKESILSKVIERINNLPEASRPLVKGNKRYTMVQDRVEALRMEYGDRISVVTQMISYNALTPLGETVIFSASIIDPDGRVLATGHAKESWSSSRINATSALENAETSAIGRALACFGVHGGEFASANEVEQAIIVQETQKKTAPPQEKAVKPSKTPEQWLSLVNAIISEAEKQSSLDALRSVWTRNIGDIEELRSINKDRYGFLFDRFQQLKTSIGLGNDQQEVRS